MNYVMLAINIIAFILGVIFQFKGSANIFWNFYGLIMVTAFIGNIYIAYLNKKHIYLSYTYPIMTVIGMIVVPILNMLASSSPTIQSSKSFISTIIILILFLLGVILSYINIKTEGNINEIDKASETKGIIRLLKTIIALLLSSFLLLGVLISYVILNTHRRGLYEIIVELIGAPFSLFYAFVFLSIGVLLFKLLSENKLKVLRIFIIILSIGNFVICIMPFFAIPIIINKADNAFYSAFGENLSITKEDNKYFRNVRFSIPEYFFGTRSFKYNLDKDVLFYEGTDGVDKGLRLYFDAYTPVEDGEDTDVYRPVLIRIHGGGWVFGNKGLMNVAQMNKYFANKGYVVFDIQYGLSNTNLLYDRSTMHDIRFGNFSVNDMVRHINIFTSYLERHQEDYKTNLDSVFISGGSAGGHLTLATGLSLENENINLKGLIPFYPANELPKLYSVNGSEELVNPSLLVNEESPPCLIYQGTHDGQVRPTIAVRFLESYLNKGNKEGAIIWMPFGGHASDLYFSGYYNQIFLYYMERFMYIYR